MNAAQWRSDDWFTQGAAGGILARSPVPILVGRPSGAWSARSALPSAPRVLAPLDCTPSGNAALALAAELAAVGPARLVLTHTVPERDGLEEGLDELRAVARRLRTDRLSLNVNLDVRIGAAVDGLVAAALGRSRLVIVMGAGGRAASEVLWRVAVPVLLVGPVGGRR